MPKEDQRRWATPWNWSYGRRNRCRATRCDVALLLSTGTQLRTISTVNVYHFKESLLYLRVDYKLIVKDTKVRVLDNTSTALRGV